MQLPALALRRGHPFETPHSLSHFLPGPSPVPRIASAPQRPPFPLQTMGECSLQWKQTAITAILLGQAEVLSRHSTPPLLGVLFQRSLHSPSGSASHARHYTANQPLAQRPTPRRGLFQCHIPTRPAKLTEPTQHAKLASAISTRLLTVLGVVR